MDIGQWSDITIKDCFEKLTESKQKIILASGESIYAQGIGAVKIKTKFCRLTLRNVWYVPKLLSNFLSINKIVKSGHIVRFTEKKAVMRSRRNEIIFTANLVNDMFIVNFENCEKVSGVIDENIARRWHQRFGHINVNDLNEFNSKNMVKGMNVKIPKTIECFTCAVNKISATPYRTYAGIQTKAVLELVHTDLCGPIGVKSVGGSSYFITFIDDYSRYITTYFLKNKSKAFDAFLNFSVLAEKETSQQIKMLRSGNGKEFINSKFKEYFAKKGVVHQTTDILLNRMVFWKGRIERLLKWRDACWSRLDYHKVCGAELLIQQLT